MNVKDSNDVFKITFSLSSEYLIRYIKDEIKRIIKNIIPLPNGRPIELTKNLSMKLANDGNPGIIPSIIKIIINELISKDETMPKVDIFLLFLKYIIKAKAGIVTKFNR